MDVPNEYAGKAIEVMGTAGGIMEDMSSDETMTHLTFRIPSRTISPSRPTSGLEDASKTTAMVGSSTAMGAISTGLAVNGYARLAPDDDNMDMVPLLDTIVSEIPAPEVDVDGPVALQVAPPGTRSPRGAWSP